MINDDPRTALERRPVSRPCRGRREGRLVRLAMNENAVAIVAVAALVNGGLGLGLCIGNVAALGPTLGFAVFTIS